MCISNKDNKCFIFPKSCFHVFEKLGEQDKGLALDYVKAIMNYGFRREKPDEDSPLWIYGLDCAFSLIDGSWEKDAKIWAEVMNEEDK